MRHHTGAFIAAAVWVSRPAGWPHLYCGARIPDDIMHYVTVLPCNQFMGGTQLSEGGLVTP